MRDSVPKIDGNEAIVNWFGTWPSFHDAEVISLLLARAGQSVLTVYPYFPQKPAAVQFIFEEVSDLELHDFSSQNVIQTLEVGIAVDQNGDQVYRTVLAPCYGLSGRIDSKSVRVELVCGKSQDGVSDW